MYIGGDSVSTDMLLQTCMYIYQWVCVWHLVTGTAYVAGEGILKISVRGQLIGKSVTMLLLLQACMYIHIPMGVCVAPCDWYSVRSR